MSIMSNRDTSLQAIQRFRAWREETGRTTITAARDLGLKSPSAIVHIEKGRRGVSLRTAQRIETLTSGWAFGPIRAVEWVTQ